MISAFIKLYDNNKSVYRIFLFIVSVLLIVYLIPKNLVFKDEFSKNSTWKHDDLVAEFDFAITKSEEQISAEKKYIEETKQLYFNLLPEVGNTIQQQLQSSFQQFNYPPEKQKLLANQLKNWYEKGVVRSKTESREKVNPKIIIIQQDGKTIKTAHYSDLMDERHLVQNVSFILNDSIGRKIYQQIVPFLKYNVQLNNEITENEKKQAQDNIAQTYGLVKKGETIIEKNQMVDEENYNKLVSYKKEFENKVWNSQKQWFLTLGYTILISLALAILFLFLYHFRKDVIQDNIKVTFLIFNVLSILLTTFFMEKFFPDYMYIIPFCLQPIVIRSFFDYGVAIIAFLVTILIASFIVPNSFEFFYIQITAGIITILTNQKLHKRVNLYIAVAKIIIIYELAYLAGLLIQNGSLTELYLIWRPMGMFFISGILTFLVFPVIYFYEKTFGLMSDLSLLELSDSNHPLIRLLSTKAPGTLQHSIQVANLAEEAAIEVGADSLLVKIGAMYHDIGKINNPMYFIENYKFLVNPHDELLPTESARIIIKHVIDGIDLAKKYKLPDAIIDFIRTHHGDSVVQYFYVKQKEMFPNEPIDIKQFKYKGPKPFSKETAILMMCDSIEAASRSLKNPSSIDLQNLVEKITEKQLETDQFDLADITLREIEMIKKVIIKRLINIYHVRIEYPE